MKNEKATVTTLITRDDVQKHETEVFVNRISGGSIPSFITSYLQDKTLSEEEAQNIKDMIDGGTRK